MDEFDYKFARGQFGRIGAGMVAFLASTIIVQLAAVFLIALINVELLSQDWFTLILGIVSTYGVGMPLAILIIRKGKKALFSPTGKMKAKDFLLAFCVMYAIMMIGNIISQLLMGGAGFILNKEIANPVDMSYQGVALWLELFSVAVLAPVLEEYLFRKCVIDAVLPYGEGTAIILSALTFGLAHGNFFQFFYAAGLGAIMSYIYIRTGKIRNTMILHCMINLAGGVVPLFITNIEDKLALYSLSAIFSFTVFAAAISGIVLFFVNIRKLTTGKPAMQIPKGNWFKTVFLNPGIILFVLLSAALFVYSMMR